MSHFTAGFILAGVFLAIGAAISIACRRKNARRGEVVGAVAFLGLGGAQLLITIVALQASKNGAGQHQNARLVETAAGPRVVTIDVVEHTDVLMLLSRHGGSLTWKE